MDEVQALFQGFAVALSPVNIGLMFVGILLGVLIGVLPGLGGANGVAILLPLTFSMNPTSAIIMLAMPGRSLPICGTRYSTARAKRPL